MPKNDAGALSKRYYCTIEKFSENSFMDAHSSCLTYSSPNQQGLNSPHGVYHPYCMSLPRERQTKITGASNIGPLVIWGLLPDRAILLAASNCLNSRIYDSHGAPSQALASFAMPNPLHQDRSFWGLSFTAQVDSQLSKLPDLCSLLVLLPQSTTGNFSLLANPTEGQCLNFRHGQPGKIKSS